MNSPQFCILFIILVNTCTFSERISDKRLCGDPTCSKPVSRAKTLIHYISDDSRLLTFGKNVDVVIYSKSAGSKPDLWGAELNGRRGYLPKNLVREYKILNPNLPYEVDTELAENTRSSDLKNGSSSVPSISSSIETNRAEIEATDRSKLKIDDETRKEEIVTKTPTLEPSSIINSVFSDISFPSFPGPGVSAEPYENDRAPNPEDISQPVEVVEGTTLYLGTDGNPSPQPHIAHGNVNKANEESPETVSHGTSSTEATKTDKDDVENEENIEVEEEGSAGRIYQYISSWMSEGSGEADKQKDDLNPSKDSNVQNQSVDSEGSGSVEGKNVVEIDEAAVEKDVSEEAKPGRRAKREVGEEDSAKHFEDAHPASLNTKESDESSIKENVITDEKAGLASEGVTGENAGSASESKKETEDEEQLDDEEEEEESEEDDYYDDEEGEEEYDEEEENEESTESQSAVDEQIKRTEDSEDELKKKEEVLSDSGPLQDGKVDVLKEEVKESVDSTPPENTAVPVLSEQKVTPVPSTVDDTAERFVTPVPLAVDKSADHLVTTGSVTVNDNLGQVPAVASTEGDGLVQSETPPSTVVDNLVPEPPVQSIDGTPVHYVTPSSAVDDKLGQASPVAMDYATSVVDSEQPMTPAPVSADAATDVESGNYSEALNETSKDAEPAGTGSEEMARLFSNNLYQSGNEYLQDRTAGDASSATESADVHVSTEQLEHTPEPIPFTDTASGVQSSEVPIPEQEEAAVVEEVTEPPVEEITEPSATEEMEIEVPQYEPVTEVTTTTLTPEELLEEDEVVIEEKPVESSEGYFSQLTGMIWSMFGGSASESVVEQVTENVVETTTESLMRDEESDRLNRKRDAAWSSLWGSHSEEQEPSEERKSAACRVDHGIDSDCSDVAGELPGSSQRHEGVPNHFEDALNVKLSEDDNVAMDLQRSTYDIFVCLVITGVTVLVFSLGYFYLEKKRRDGSLVAKINELEKALLVSSKECLILKDDLEATKERLLSFESSSVDSSEVVATLNVELEESKVAKAELEEHVSSLEKELEAATEAGLELNRMLTDFLSSQNSSEAVMKSVEHLQKQLDSQQNTISSLTESLNVKTAENESLQSDLNSALDKISSLEENVHKVNENLTDVLSEKLRMEEELLEKNKSVESQIEELKTSKAAEIQDLQKEITDLQDTVNELKENLVTKESEVTVLQDCMKQLKSSDDEDGEDKMQALLDVGRTKAELKLMTMERDTLSEKLQGEEDARKLLEDHVKIVTEEVTRLRESYEEAEKEKVEAQTRLEVLSNYFKEKETQLQKELGLQEAMCLQKEGDATSTYERIKSLQEEVETYKSQIETFKKEIIDQERGLKSQIATLEKRAHENWVAARQAERKLEDSKQEAGQLRNRLTIVEKNATNASKNSEATKMNDRLPGDSNGELPTSPIHMGISPLDDTSSSSPQMFQHDSLPPSNPLTGMLPGPPLPPNAFIPPPGMFMPPLPGAPFLPPPPPHFPDRRPPPLGRMSSPPPRFSPPPPDPRGTYSPYDDRSPPPSPPPGRYRSPPPHGNNSPDRFRQHRSPPPMPHFYSTPTSRMPPHWDESYGASRSGFRPLPPSTHRESPREPKGSAMSSGHSSESLEKSSRHSGRV